MLTNHTFVLTTPSWNIKLPDRYYQINVGLSTKYNLDSVKMMMIPGSYGILVPTDAYELLRCEAAPAILQTFEIR